MARFPTLFEIVEIRTLLAFTVVISLAIPGSLVVEAATPDKKSDVPAYFAFGDSLADVGTNNFLPQATARADFPPYGITFFHKPTGRFTNGRNIVDFIAQALGLPFAPPFLQPNASFITGVNFASAGSGLLDSTSAGTVNPMRVQLQQYASARATLQKHLGVHGAKKLISKSIFVVLSGSNDLSGFLSNSELQKQMNATQFIASVIQAYNSTLLELYNSGARKTIIFDVGPIGCTLAARATNQATESGECLIQGNELASNFNVGLKKLIDRLRVTLPEFNVVLAATFDLITAMIADGKASGLTNVSSACCGAGFLNAQVQCGKPVPSTLPDAVSAVCKRPSKSLFWDNFHPTQQVVSLLFKAFWTGDVTVAYPISFQALAAL